MVDPTSTDAAIHTLKQLAIVQTVVMSIAGVLIALVLRGYYAGKWVQKSDDDHGRLFETVDANGIRIAAVEDDIRGLDTKFREVFVPREVYTINEGVNRRDRLDMKSDIGRVWEAIERLERRK